MTISRIRIAPILLSVALLLAGCLPIELDVSADGKILIARAEGYFALEPSTGKVERLYAPQNAKPVFGRFMPDGKSIIAINETGESAMGMGRSFSVEQVTIADGTARTIFSGSNLTYAAVSPDGSTLAVTQLASEQAEGLDEKLPELLLVDIRAGTNQKVAANAAPFIRWFPDSSGVLTYTIKSKSAEKGDYLGVLAKIAADGTAKPLCAVLSGNDLFLEMSPDGSKALFTALGAAAPDAEIEQADTPALFELNIASGEAKRVAGVVTYAIYSPDGKSILLGGSEKEEQLALSVADATTPGEARALGQGMPKNAGGNSGTSAAIYPSWLDNDTILYLASRPAYGTAGINLHLVTLDIAPGAKPADFQALIESAVQTAK